MSNGTVTNKSLLAASNLILHDIVIIICIAQGAG